MRGLAEAAIRHVVGRRSRGAAAATRFACVLALLVAAAVVSACDSSSDRAEAPSPTAPRAETAPPPRDAPAPPATNPSRAEQLIQAWLAALELEDYKRAAGYFARGALVDQGDPFRLATRADAITFNRELPCRAHLTGVRREPHTALATFLLSDGPGGSCNGSVRVRFTIRHGRFTVFHQLLDDPAASSVSA
jgi:hypothetical protein